MIEVYQRAGLHLGLVQIDQDESFVFVDDKYSVSVLNSKTKQDFKKIPVTSQNLKCLCVAEGMLFVG